MKLYAPVCIPTLNRYEHLQKCLESLSRCTWADQTEVYVALDYPPINQWEKYAPGWERNRAFLCSCGDMGFKKLHVIERSENYGIWTNRNGHKTNFGALYDDYIEGKYPYYIYSEDDNVFSPCFLEYMNKGFEIFKDDDKVYSLGGYKFYYPIKSEKNTFIRQTVDYSPWGVGLWTRKTLPILDYVWFRKQITIAKLIYLKKTYGWGVISGVFAKSAKPRFSSIPIDNDVWTYMQISNIQQITPTKTLVQNIGLDGSGETMQNAVGLHEEWCDPTLNPLAADEHFEFVGTGYEHYEDNLRIYYHGKYWKSELSYFARSIRKAAKFLMNI